MKPFEIAVDEIATAQGWPAETVAELAFGFLVNAADPVTQADFLAWAATEAQHESDAENGTGDFRMEPLGEHPHDFGDYSDVQ